MPSQPSCPEPQELGRLTRGELPEERAILLRGHVRSCDACAGALAAFRPDETLLTGEVRPAVPAATPDRTLEAERAGPAGAEAAPVQNPNTGGPRDGGRMADQPAVGPPGVEAPPRPAPSPADDYLAPPQTPGELG